MRTLIVALGFAALAAGPALAQNVSRGSTSSSASGTAATTGTTTATTSGGTATNGNSGFNVAPSGTTDRGIAAPASSATAADNASTPPSSAPPENVTSDIHAATPGSSFAQGGPFTNDSGNTALGTSPGQTSSGTFAGNSSAGIGADSSTLNGGVANTGTVSLVPEGTVSVIGGGSGARLVGVPNAVSPQGTAPGAGTATPLYDQAAREGRAREARRRAQGDEPRVYGIAPNTERDLTWQMPDDRIIRY